MKCVICDNDYEYKKQYNLEPFIETWVCSKHCFNMAKIKWNYNKKLEKANNNETVSKVSNKTIK